MFSSFFSARFHDSLLLGLSSRSGRGGRFWLARSLAQVVVMPLAPVSAVLCCLGRSSSVIARMEFTKTSCLCVKNEEMDLDPMRLVSAVNGHLTGRPCIVRSIFLCVRSNRLSSVLVDVHSSDQKLLLLGFDLGTNRHRLKFESFTFVTVGGRWGGWGSTVGAGSKSSE